MRVYLVGEGCEKPIAMLRGFSHSIDIQPLQKFGCVSRFVIRAFACILRGVFQRGFQPDFLDFFDIGLAKNCFLMKLAAVIAF